MAGGKGRYRALRLAPPLVAGVVLAAGCPATRQAKSPRGMTAEQAAQPPPSIAGDGSLRQVARRDEVRLTGPRVDARPGDWMLENAGRIAVVDAHGGRLIDFGGTGHEDQWVSMDQTVRSGSDDLKPDIVSIGPSPTVANVLCIERRLARLALRLWTFIAFAGPVLEVESLATSDGGASPPIELGETVGWGNVPTWVEGTGFVHGPGTFRGEFLAREGLGVAYALALQGGPTTAHFGTPTTAGFHEHPRTGEGASPVPAGGPSPRRIVRIAYAEGSIGDAVTALLRAQGETLEPISLPAVAAERASAEVAGCPQAERAEGSPFARYALGRQARSVLLPRRCFQFRASAPGYESSPWSAAPASPAFEPKAGRLRWHVVEAGAGTLPARLVVRGVPPTPDPDWGDEPHGGAALDTIYTLADGAAAVPPGGYRVTISHGPEYTTAEQTVEIDDGRTTTVNATLERVVDTSGWISADMHVHAVPSYDAPTLLDERVRSLAAAGVEVAVATDHNAVTDYEPTIRSLRANKWLASVVGDEVTTRGVEFGHFNVFPLIFGQPPVPYEDTNPHELFAAARAAPPAAGKRIVQVNHPRMGSIGYFSLVHFDDERFEEWRNSAPMFDSSFDALEVYNGQDISNLEHVEQCLRDWYALLDAGLRVTATGNSDSHKLAYHEAGVPRNFVRLARDAPEAFDQASFMEAVRQGRVVVSSGPFLRLRAGGADIGDEIDPGPTLVDVRVEAPPWVDVRSVAIVRRGLVVKTWRVPRTTNPLRLHAQVSLSLRPRDWILAVAEGEQPMTLLSRADARPFAFTNPIWVRQAP